MDLVIEWLSERATARPKACGDIHLIFRDLESDSRHRILVVASMKRHISVCDVGFSSVGFLQTLLGQIMEVSVAEAESLALTGAAFRLITMTRWRSGRRIPKDSMKQEPPGKAS